MNNINLDSILFSVCNIAIEAGSVINKYYRSTNVIFMKEDQSPVTKADLESNKFIIKSLHNLDLDIPILTEESLVDWSVRKHWTKYWLVDPLDGTKEFIKNNGEFTVNIALIENNEPILGAIYAPALSVLYYSKKEKGSYKIACDQKINSLFNSTQIYTSQKKQSDHLRIFGSRSHSNKKFDNWILNNFQNYELIRKGSSLKFCELAEGKADLYPRFGPTSEWDIAAGHIILNEAGGEIKSIENEKILYNSKESVINPHFIASCKYRE